MGSKLQQKINNVVSFIILRRKTDDYDRWLGGMRRLQGQFEDVYKKREESQDD